MSSFLQFHFLTVYPPSNPNRDDLGRPKTAVYGGALRLRLSSQSIKRAARMSDTIQNALSGHLGSRTQRLGDEIRAFLLEHDADEKKALDIAKAVADVYGKLDDRASKKDLIRTRQLAFISPDEWKFAEELALKALKGEPLPDEKALKKLVLRTADGAADIAMFGRMLAGDQGFNREAAVQVSHAITTHKAAVEDDFYTAVDDLKNPAEDADAGFVGGFVSEAGFGSGVYYLYACVDLGLLVENLAGDRKLAQKTVTALAEALATSSPSGKQNSFAHQTRAGYIRAEYGAQQPRSLAGAFFKPVSGDDLMQASIEALDKTAAQMDRAYGATSERRVIMDVVNGSGSLAEIKSFAEKCLSDD